MPKYIMRISDGVLFPYETHSHWEQDARYKLHIEGEPAPVAADEAADEAADRFKAVLAAVHAVPVENYGKNGRPNVGTVSELAGFKVTAEEIQAALEQTK